MEGLYLRTFFFFSFLLPSATLEEVDSRDNPSPSPKRRVETNERTSSHSVSLLRRIT